MPHVKKTQVFATMMMAFLIMAVFGGTCLYVASAGGPAWLEGNEMDVFLKLAALTLVAAVAEISWRYVHIRHAHHTETEAH